MVKHAQPDREIVRRQEERARQKRIEKAGPKLLAENATLRDTLGRIVMLCQDSRKQHGNNAGALCAMRLSIEQLAAQALGQSNPANRVW
jgi:hypothetical protein